MKFKLIGIASRSALRGTHRKITGGHQRFDGIHHRVPAHADHVVQVEAVMKMLDPDFNARAISAKRRNTGNPWFKRGTLYRSAIDVLRRAGKPMTAREMTDALLDGKSPVPTHKQDEAVQAAILSALRNHAGKGVQQVNEGMCRTPL